MEVSSIKGNNSSSNRRELTSNQLELMKNILSGVCSFLIDQYQYGMVSLYDDKGEIYLRVYSSYVVLREDGSVYARTNSSRRKIRIHDEKEFANLIRATVKNIEKLPFNVKKVEFECSNSGWSKGYIKDSIEEQGSKDLELLC